jgi:hypothetical protein
MLAATMKLASAKKGLLAEAALAADEQERIAKMARSKALVRIRSERQDANLRLSEARATWLNIRRDVARMLDLDWIASGETRANDRDAAVEQLHEQLNKFATNLALSRLTDDSARAAFLAELVGAVNDMIGAFAEARTERRDNELILSKRVKDFLEICRGDRLGSILEHTTQRVAYRAKLSEDVFRACTNDFRSN